MKLKELLLRKAAEQEKLDLAMTAVNKINQDIANIDDDIEAIISGPVKQARELSVKTTGTVDVLVQGVMVKHAIQKSVKWDQAKLTAIRARITAYDDDPDNYMESKTTHKVSEKSYKAMPPAIKAVFDPARTVVGGKTKVSFDLNRM